MTGNNETIAVIGGAGYIGSVNVDALIEAGKQVVVIDNLEYGHRDAVHPEAGFEECDIRNASAVERVFDRHSIDAVMHFGAYAYVGESMTKADEYFQNNVWGGHHLLNSMRKRGIERIVFSSTCAVYGDVKTVPIDESLPLNPINPYGRTKLAFELLLKSYEDAYGIRHAILRYFNAAGATERLGEDHRPETHLIPLIMDAATGKRENITIFGTDYDTPDGTCVRDYIHVSDLAEAHVKALEATRDRSLICNLGSEHGHSVREVIESVKRVTGLDVNVVEEARRPGDPPRLTASAARAKSLLGWTPRYTAIDEIVETAWHWRQAHPEGYSN